MSLATLKVQDSRETTFSFTFLCYLHDRVCAIFAFVRNAGGAGFRLWLTNPEIFWCAAILAG